MTKYIFAILILFCQTSIIFSQTDSTQSLEDLIEFLVEESTIDVEDSQLFDLFEELLQNPPNANSTNE